MTTTINKEQKNPNVPNLRFPEFEGEWKRTSLKDISTVNPKSASLEESFVYIDLEAVEKGILKKQQTILRSEAPSRAQRVIMDGDILFQCVRPYQKNNYLHKGQNNDKTQWVASTGYAQIRTTESPSYLYHTLNTDGFNKKVMVRCTGSSYPAINSDDLSTIHFYFSPQKEEQRKISQLFDLLDERIATQNKIIEDLKKLKCAIIDYTIDSIQADYTEFETMYVAAGEGGTPSTSKKEYYENGRIPFVKIENLKQKYLVSNKDYITELGLQKSSAWLIPANSILFSNGATIGEISITTYPVCTKQGILGIVPKADIDTEYLYYLMSSRYFKKEIYRIITEGTMKTAYLKDINKIRCPIPSKAVQQEIVRIPSAMNTKIETEQSILNKLICQKQYLLRQMFI